MKHTHTHTHTLKNELLSYGIAINQLKEGQDLIKKKNA
jgi:hypothetical protein